MSKPKFRPLTRFQPVRTRGKHDRESGHQPGRPTAHQLAEARRRVTRLTDRMVETLRNLHTVAFSLSRTPRRTDPDDPYATLIIEQHDYLRAAVNELEQSYNMALLWLQMTNPKRGSERDEWE